MARILVVDDDYNILQVLRMRLVSDGHHVTTASDAAEALTRSKTDRVDLALIDLKLKNEDGMALMETLCHQIPGLPVIILTAYGSIDTAVAAIDLTGVLIRQRQRCRVGPERQRVEPDTPVGGVQARVHHLLVG